MTQEAAEAQQDSSGVADLLSRFNQRVSAPPLTVEGRLTRIVGLRLEAVGCMAPIGSRCRILSDCAEPLEAEVVGFSGNSLYLMPEGGVRGLMPGARVIPEQGHGEVAVGKKLLGRIIDGAGRPLDARGEVKCTKQMPLLGKPINPLHRRPISQPLDVGVRAINGLLTIGRGQRLGLFSGSGVGKSTLLGMMTRNTEADVVVVGLIGERGREVREFVDHILGEAGLSRAVVVATPADEPPLMRIHGAWRATAIAEYFRSRGKNVLLLMDSLTRFAQAQREIALAVGEPPVTKGYPPSVFTLLPKLVERAGNGNGDGGSITAIYTVLVEGDDHNDPIADAARAILDGHIALSRTLADAGVYPAVDVEASVSRSMAKIVDPAQLTLARQFKGIYATYQQNRDLVNIGAYEQGSDPAIDRAIKCFPKLQQFLQQDEWDKVDFTASLQDFLNLSKTWIEE